MLGAASLRDAPAWAALRTAQASTPPGVRLDLFDVSAPGLDVRAALREALAERDSGAYDLTLFVAGGNDRDEDGVEEAEGTFRVLLDGAPVYALSAAEAPDFTLAYRQLTIPVTVATAGTHTVRIELQHPTATDDVLQFIVDDVSVAPSGLRLTVAPATGSVAAGGMQALTVTADATNATPGQYTAQLRIDTDDPAQPTLTVGVTVEVRIPVAGESASALPTEFALRQSYPNPAAGRTAIAYDLPEAADVRLDVFDVTGRRVMSLVDAPQAAGRYTAIVDAQTLPSGTYVYRIQAGRFREAHRLVVVR